LFIFGTHFRGHSLIVSPDFSKQTQKIANQIWSKTVEPQLKEGLEGAIKKATEEAEGWEKVPEMVQNSAKNAAKDKACKEARRKSNFDRHAQVTLALPVSKQVIFLLHLGFTPRTFWPTIGNIRPSVCRLQWITQKNPGPLSARPIPQ
jgi:hypothetical protein